MTPSFSIRHPSKMDARGKYLMEERERMKLSATLAETFPDLKSLSGLLSYFAPSGRTPQTEVKCTYNLAHAKALFRFGCPNHECVGGNFDLSAALANAVAERREIVTGELRCAGWQSKATIDQVYCDHVMRFKLKLEF